MLLRRVKSKCLRCKHCPNEKQQKDCRIGVRPGANDLFRRVKSKRLRRNSFAQCPTQTSSSSRRGCFFASCCYHAFTLWYGALSVPCFESRVRTSPVRHGQAPGLPSVTVKNPYSALGAEFHHYLAILGGCTCKMIVFM